MGGSGGGATQEWAAGARSFRGSKGIIFVFNSENSGKPLKCFGGRMMLCWER